MKTKILIIVALAILLVEGLVSRLLNVSTLWGWMALNTVLFSLIPLAILFGFQEGVRDVGLSLQNWKISLKYAFILVILALPLMVYGAKMPQFKTYYPIWGPARANIKNLIILEAAMALLMFNTEFFFRGFLLFNLREFFNFVGEEKARWIAIVLHSLPYVIVHIGKPGLEVPYSFFVGLVFGYVALETRSVLSPLVAHWTSSVIFDVMCLWI
ncbi:MAG: type II CAAX prenyl endopeptidase Rce1 family protein, partial [Candidatus Hydrothermarchaeales archaeon]